MRCLTLVLGMIAVLFAITVLIFVIFNVIPNSDPAVRIHADYSNLAQCAATDFTCAAAASTTRSGDQPFAQGRARGFADMVDGVLDGRTRSGAVGQSVGSSGVLVYSWLLCLSHIEEHIILCIII